MLKQMNLKPQHTIYQNKASNCRAESYYECFERIYLTNTENCSKKCTGYSLPSLPNCKTNEKIKCSNDLYNRLFLNIRYQTNNGTQCPRPCTMFEYLGEETWTTKLSNYFNGTHGLAYQFDPPESVTVNEEYLIYDEVSMIGSVGGTLGMCIGFSFTNVISCILNYFQNVYNHTKLSNGRNNVVVSFAQ